MEQETKVLLDNLMEGCQIIGFDWKYIYINKIAEKHNKRSNEELIGKRYMDMWPGIEETKVFKFIKDCLEKRISFKMDNEFIFPDGQIGWFELSIQPIEQGVFILSHDISERKRTENKIELERFYLQEAQDIGKIGTWELDLRSDILKWTKENYKIFGVKIGTALNYQSFVDCLHPDDKDYVQKKWMEGTKGKPYDIVHRIISKGKVKWVREKAKLYFDEDGKVYKAIGVTQDISMFKNSEIEIKKSKKSIEEYIFKLNYILKNIPIGISVLNQHSEIIFNNYGLNKILRLSEKSIEHRIYINRKYWNSKGEEISFNDFPSSQVIKGRKAIHNSEIKIQLEDGNFIWTEVSALPVEISDWKVLTVIIDITDRKIAEEKQNKTAKELLDANATKDKFFSIIAHDLRNPFNIIMGMSELLLSRFDIYNKEKQIEFIEAINSSSKQTLSLLENLLEWSRSQTGLIKFSPEELVLEQLIDQVIGLQTQFAKKKNIKIKFNISGSPIINADKFMLRTILRNLLSNAIKFTENDGKINISVSSSNRDNIISIEDNGVGMNKEQIDNLYVLSSKNVTYGTNNEKGTGLGLILCKEFIEKHNGKLTIKSEVGKGSKFEIILPQ